MAKRTNPAMQKLIDELTEINTDRDRWESRLYRAANRLQALRTTRKRKERELAKLQATT
jgi:septal ring factor EnvC (AmiA/AmiB activator)